MEPRIQGVDFPREASSRSSLLAVWKDGPHLPFFAERGADPDFHVCSDILFLEVI